MPWKHRRRVRHAVEPETRAPHAPFVLATPPPDQPRSRRSDRGSTTRTFLVGALFLIALVLGMTVLAVTAVYVLDHVSGESERFEKARRQRY